MKNLPEFVMTYIQCLPPNLPPLVILTIDKKYNKELYTWLNTEATSEQNQKLLLTTYDNYHNISDNDQPLSIKQVIKRLNQIENQNLPLYVTIDPYNDNIPIKSITLFDEYEPHTETNPLGINIQ